jgi:hypothetical protein
MVEKQALKEALEDLGYSVEEGDLRLWGFGAGQAKVEMKISTGFLSAAIGFRRTRSGTYEVVADWWGVRGIRRKTFLEQLTQRYAYRVARAKLAEQGFELVSEQTEQDGRIHLVLRRTA